MKSQLLCTFTTKESLYHTLQEIRETYTLVYKNIFVLQSKKDSDTFLVTYNIDTSHTPSQPLRDTIAIHRNKDTNTLYTINAINQLVKDQNDGVLDKAFPIDWTPHRNSFLNTDKEGLVQVNTRIYEIYKF